MGLTGVSHHSSWDSFTLFRPFVNDLNCKKALEGFSYVLSASLLTLIFVSPLDSIPVQPTDLSSVVLKLIFYSTSYLNLALRGLFYSNLVIVSD